MDRISPLIASILAATICGCGGGSSSPTPPSIQVMLSTMPPSTIAVNGSANVGATVVNDMASAGVSWSCTPTGACGTFSPTSTKSGATTMYTAPSAAPNGGSVNIIATSVTNSSAFISAMVAISGTASNATLKGQYAFLIRANVGNQSTRGNTTFIGSVTLDGAGNVTGGEEEIIASLYPGDRADPIVPTNPAMIPNTSYYSVDANGHAIMRLKTQTFGETLDLSLVVTSASHAEVIETAGDPGSGTFDLQTTKTGQAGGFDISQISGNYAFTLDGVDPSQVANPPNKLSIGGVFQANAGNIVSGIMDVNNNGTTTLGTPFAGSTLTLPDTNGRGQLHFTGSPTGPTPTVTVITFYIVNDKVLRVFEDDGTYLTGGSVYAQSSAAPPQMGNFVYQHTGWSSGGRTVTAGQFTAGAGGSISAGVSDSNTGGAPTVAKKATTASGTYMPPTTPTTTGTLTLTDAAGPSTFNVYPVDPALNILDPNNTSGGGGALLLHTDPAIVGSGTLLPQNVGTTPNFQAGFALNLLNEIKSSSSREVALTGVFTSDGSANFTGGVADYDADDTVNPSTSVMLLAPFTGTYMADAMFPGHFNGTFTIPTTIPTGGYPFIIPSTTTFNVSIYQASSAQAFVIQTDTAANSFGHVVQQLIP